MEHYVCIHGHFYQPPRENAWLEHIEWQDSAYPYHDWNEKITAECYLPNASSRLLDRDGRIENLVNNYAFISFDFGPTLLSWMEKAEPDVYRAIIEADRQSRERFSGHGSAIAQAYNHIIMPLANHRDRITQVRWGVRDFEHRFGRRPEGMWLPETAVDLKTLEIMAEIGLSFTILSPHQARRVRPSGSAGWEKISGAGIDTTQPYHVSLPSGRKFAVFFFDDAISRAVAFEGLLKNGENFAGRLLAAFPEKDNRPRVVSIATDGETYGHHYPFADMALAYALHRIVVGKRAKITNFGEYLEKHPPAWEVEIVEKSSWSCKHGVDRWWSDCGDTTGASSRPDWNQKWRTPLRNAFDYLRDTLAPRFEEKARHYLRDPWAARDDYIDVILDRSGTSVERFLQRHARKVLEETEKVTVLKLLELQRHCLLMYTSCGWFFDEVSRPEPVQVLQYAGRVVQLARELFQENVEENFLQILEQAKSNIPEQGDARRIYERLIRPEMIGLERVAVHDAISSLFEKKDTRRRVYCYSVENRRYDHHSCGDGQVVIGESRVTSEVTAEAALFDFGVIRRGWKIRAGVVASRGPEKYQTVQEEVTQACSRGDFDGAVSVVEGYFGSLSHSLTSLFRDEQHRILGRVLDDAILKIGASYLELYQHHYSPGRLLSELGGPVPRVFQASAEVVINRKLHQVLNDPSPDHNTIRDLLTVARDRQIEIDTPGLSYDLKRWLERAMAELTRDPADTDHLRELMGAVALVRSLPLPVDLGKVRKHYWEMLLNLSAITGRAASEEAHPERWMEMFRELGRLLDFKMLEESGR